MTSASNGSRRIMALLLPAAGRNAGARKAAPKRKAGGPFSEPPA